MTSSWSIFYPSGACCVKNVVSHGCPVEALSMLQVGGVDLNMDILGEHLLMTCNRYWRYDALDFCLKTIKFKSFLNKALLLEMRTGTLYGVKLLADSGANLHMQTTIILISYTLGREYRVMRNRYSRLLFTSEDRLCANLRVQEQSTNMTSQC